MKNFFKILLLISCLWGSGQLHAQLLGQALIDSLLKELPRQKEDTNKANLLFRLGRKYLQNKPDESIKYATDALALCQKIDWRYGMLSANAILGLAYRSKADHARSLTYYIAALAIAEELNDKDAEYNMYMNMGLAYEGQRNNARALEFYLKALKGFEEFDNKKRIAGVTNNIGNVYYDLKNYSKALHYYNKARTMNQKLGNKSWEAFNINNIGIVYNDMGDYQKALDHYLMALKINEELQDTATMGINFANIGYTNHKIKNYTVALVYHARALDIARMTGDRHLEGNAVGNIGETYFRIATDTAAASKKPDSVVRLDRNVILNKAVQLLKTSISLYTEVGDVGSLQELTASLSEVYYETGNYTDALYWYKQSVTFKDSVFNTENSVKIANLETERELQLKDKQIEIDKLAVAKKRNERGFFIAGMGGLLLVIAVTFRSYKTQKTSNKLLSVEKRKSEDLLLNILPSEVADELKEKGVADAKHFDNVTVLFTDFVNFTEAGERMSPKQLVDELHSCFKAFDGILSKYSIEKIKTVGDAYLAVSGLPVANVDHGVDIVKAAAEMRDFMLDRKQQLGSATFEMRIGIHSGSVVAGIVGVKKFAYDIWGDTVNTAARMEQHGAPGKINISQTSYELVKDKFSCEYRGELEVKGKGVMKMYFVS